jgi:hypothetical protein
LADDHDQPDPIQVLAPSGVAALNIQGCTLHSGFSLPLNGFSELSGSQLANMQLLWEGVYFVIIDKKSMFSLRTLAQINARCRQLFPLYRLFTQSFRLQVVHRQGGDSPEQVTF